MEKSRGRFQRVAGILKSSRAGFREELSRDGLMGWLVYHLDCLGGLDSQRMQRLGKSSRLDPWSGWLTTWTT